MKLPLAPVSVKNAVQYKKLHYTKNAQGEIDFEGTFPFQCIFLLTRYLFSCLTNQRPQRAYWATIIGKTGKTIGKTSKTVVLSRFYEIEEYNDSAVMPEGKIHWGCH